MIRYRIWLSACLFEVGDDLFSIPGDRRKVSSEYLASTSRE